MSPYKDRQPQSSPPLAVKRKPSPDAISGSNSEQGDGSCVSAELDFLSDFHRDTKKQKGSENPSSTKQNQSVSSSDLKISTTLVLFDESWSSIIKDSVQEDSSKKSCPQYDFSTILSKISAMKHYTIEEEKKETEKGVCTKLSLYTDPWKIKKNLTRSDLGDLCRLLVKTSLIKNHVLSLLSEEIVTKVESTEGAKVNVLDQDTMTEHELVFKHWVSSKSYIFIGKWGKDFVRRRELREGDEIGLYWDNYTSRFIFHVLNRAPPS
ncbi:putative B3 domain-containing protein At1g78640 [Carica papaya]|uniref:putative B3 domain-containing protein At1g78640 n=1 Tax=Carica papaya TaxID=3649 RepID=UPI000B8C8D5E|nr:putative B3 domain-containing protein At1g78640 [Carica papaya]